MIRVILRLKKEEAWGFYNPQTRVFHFGIRLEPSNLIFNEQDVVISHGPWFGAKIVF